MRQLERLDLLGVGEEESFVSLDVECPRCSVSAGRCRCHASPTLPCESETWVDSYQRARHDGVRSPLNFDDDRRTPRWSYLVVEAP